MGMRRQLVPSLSAWRTCRNTKLAGVNPEPVVFVTADHDFHRIIQMEPGDAAGYVEQGAGIGDLDEQRVVAINLDVGDRDRPSRRDDTRAAGHLARRAADPKT